jgi:hypothetical protein
MWYLDQARPTALENLYLYSDTQHIRLPFSPSKAPEKTRPSRAILEFPSKKPMWHFFCWVGVVAFYTWEKYDFNGAIRQEKTWIMKDWSCIDREKERKKNQVYFGKCDFNGAIGQEKAWIMRGWSCINRENRKEIKSSILEKMRFPRDD